MTPPTRRPHRGLRRSLTAAAVLGGLLAGAPALASPGHLDQPAADAGADGSWAEQRLAEMSLEEKVGQLFVTQVYGEHADTDDPRDVARNQEVLGVDNGREAVDTYHLGGVIYFTWSDNLSDPVQVATLSNGLQEAAMEQPAEVPLLITIDQEHGIVTRLTEPATRFPGSMALGASSGTGDAHRAGRIAGTELRAVGVTMNHAPVADVNVNPANPVIGVRSFSDDPDHTSDLVTAQIDGYQAGAHGVSASTKHFPGHGNTDVDSHYALPVITHTLEEWRAIDAPPFRAAIDAGTASIMSGHLQFPELDPSGDPATLSEPIMTGLLREELGYDGVVITDSLSMEGVRTLYPDDEVPVRALQAGVDLLLMPPHLETAYEAVLAAVADGELTEERIDESVLRVLRLKEEQGLPEQHWADPEAAERVVGAAGHRAAAQEITDRTTTLLVNEDDALPLAADGQRVLVTGAHATTVRDLAERVDHRAVTATAWPAGSGGDPDDEAVREVVEAATDHDVVLVATSGARSGPGQVSLVEGLRASGAKVVTLATGVPYDIAAYPRVEAHLASYSAVPKALESAVRVIFGENDPVGTLPVTVPTADDPATVLYPFGHGLGYGDRDSGGPPASGTG